jgi:hypothetical protein
LPKALAREGARPGCVAGNSVGDDAGLTRYWATDYDWRKVEAKLNALPQFMTEVDGLDIHFIHVRSPQENALPLIITHGLARLGERDARGHRSVP